MSEVYVKKESDKRLVLDALRAAKMPYRVTIKQGGTRSLEQNAYLWGVCYETILVQGGLREQGWTREDLHEYFLGEFHGWQELEGFGRKRVKPIERSSGKSKMEFVDYVNFIHQRAAEQLGIAIPDPE